MTLGKYTFILKWKLYNVIAVYLLNYCGIKQWSKQELKAMTVKKYKLWLRKEQQKLCY